MKYQAENRREVYVGRLRRSQASSLVDMPDTSKIDQGVFSCDGAYSMTSMIDIANSELPSVPLSVPVKVSPNPVLLVLRYRWPHQRLNILLD